MSLEILNDDCIPLVENCIKKLKLNDRQRIIRGYNLLSFALYLRDNYFKYCNIPLTRGHQTFNTTLEKLINTLVQQMNAKNIRITKFDF